MRVVCLQAQSYDPGCENCHRSLPEKPLEVDVPHIGLLRFCGQDCWRAWNRPTSSPPEKTGGKIP